MGLFGDRCLLLILWLLALCGCQSQKPETVSVTIEDSQTPKVVATLSPHAWLASMIGGEAVEVIPLLPAGKDPGTWTPGDGELQKLATADLIIVNGSMLEKWVQRVSLPFSTLDLSRAVSDHWREYPGVITHSHGPEGERSWEGTDGHFWVDPALLLLQGEAILQRLIRVSPASEAQFQERWKLVSETLRNWDQRLAAIRLPDGHSIVATEPAWGYLASRLQAPLTTISPMIDQETASLSEQRPGCLLWRSEPEAVSSQSASHLGFVNVVWNPAENLGDRWAEYPRLQEAGLKALEEAASKRP